MLAVKGLGLGLLTSVFVVVSSVVLFLYNLVRSFIVAPPKFVRDPTTILITGKQCIPFQHWLFIFFGQVLAVESEKHSQSNTPELVCIFVCASCWQCLGKTLILLGRDETRLNDVKKICEKKGAKVVTKCIITFLFIAWTFTITAIDVTDREGLKTYLVAIDEQHKVDLVVANAGVTAGMCYSSGVLWLTVRSNS